MHRIRAADVWHAPTFAQAAGALATRLAGRVVVAHNLSFDARFLTAEFARVGVDLPVGGLCTMRLADRYLPQRAGRSLRACCEAAGVVLGSAHSALHDALATARLFAHYLGFGAPEAEPVPPVSLAGDVAEVRRGVAAPVWRPSEPVALARGDRVVFTGRTHSPRDVWVDRATSFGLVSQGYVTKATRVVVAADPFTLSGKAQRARAYRVPVVSEEDFAGMLDRLGVAPVAEDHRTGWPRVY